MDQDTAIIISAIGGFLLLLLVVIVLRSRKNNEDKKDPTETDEKPLPEEKPLPGVKPPLPADDGTSSSAGVLNASCGNSGERECNLLLGLECKQNKCVYRQGVPNNGACSIDSQCVGANSECKNNTCTAKSGSIVNPNEAPVAAQPVSVFFTGGGDGRRVEGGRCGIYSDGSDINRAATQQGLVSENKREASILRRYIGTQARFTGVTMNGITSLDAASGIGFKIWATGSEPECAVAINHSAPNDPYAYVPGKNQGENCVEDKECKSSSCSNLKCKAILNSVPLGGSCTEFSECSRPTGRNIHCVSNKCTDLTREGYARLRENNKSKYKSL